MEEEEEEESFKFSGWQKRQEAKKSRGFHHVSECVCVCVRFKLPGYRVRRLQLKESTDVKVRLTE